MEHKILKIVLDTKGYSIKKRGVGEDPPLKKIRGRGGPRKKKFRGLGGCLNFFPSQGAGGSN